MDQEKAFQTIVNMRDQKIPFRDIAKHLEASGYRSALTKKPIGEQAIRNIVGKIKGDDKKAEKAEKRADAIYLTKKKASTTEGIRTILSTREFTDTLKVKFIELLLKEA